ncbi:DUF423 domain-containing protein [Algiphilus sp.]|uniref:DUF423 domain-containing protein n=1 Tax=Algiphilus sp. TaxID=1872431 RepID=UPI001CA6CE18|nr:DUF423 domain-containing protein [Algiphilus sp.]MBY8965537.1 DUF423 domain-containing protein [Algiphilus acroporae]MCI5062510.1 DUF423 domain-containing protein [Algiphilus sp.]MCI5104477.1 DUF423 domain-containing protein [Algiphilus sp.]MCR9090843.1 DUF423 domain-containing protein [Pseudomonadota bacterium]
MAGLWLGIGAAFGLLGVAAGAFGAHALRARLSEDLMAVFRTAVEYQFYHVAALLAVGLLARQAQGPWLSASGIAFAFGVLVFSGSLYILALSGVRAWGAVTPIGGLALMIGWLCLIVHVARL